MKSTLTGVVLGLVVAEAVAGVELGVGEGAWPAGLAAHPLPAPATKIKTRSTTRRRPRRIMSIRLYNVTPQGHSFAWSIEPDLAPLRHGLMQHHALAPRRGTIGPIWGGPTCVPNTEPQPC